MNAPIRIQSKASARQILIWLQILVYSAIVLYVGRQFFVPISFSLLISFVLYPVCKWFESKGIGRLTAVIFSLLIMLFLGVLLFGLLGIQFVSFLDEWPNFKDRLMKSLAELSQWLVNVINLPIPEQQRLVAEFSDRLIGNFPAFISNALTASAFSIVMLILVPVYVILILYYRKSWIKILLRIFPGPGREEILRMLNLSIHTYYNFIKGMAIVYLIVGVLNSIGLLLLGIPHAILFGFIASVLTFIPYAGIIVGSLLPITMAWITYDSVWYPLGVVAVFVFVQYLEANIIFPFAVSSRLNVNTLAVLAAIFIGGILWGLSGMILFVPFIGILKLIADQNPRWKTLAMMLGSDEANGD